jgi:hypothetical protein
MKRNCLQAIALALLLSLIRISFASAAYFNSNASEAIVKKHNNISVLVHPQVELISIVQAIGNYPNILPFLMFKEEFDYKTRVLEHFSPFARHPAVQMFDRLSAQPRKLNFSAPSNIMLYTDENLNVRGDIELDDFVISRIDGMDSLEVFLGLLKEFEELSGFNDFFHDNEEYYLSIIGQTVNNLGDYTYVKELEDFYGVPQQSYNIILVSLYNSVGFGNSLLLPSGKREIYNTMGSGRFKEELPFFGDEKHLKYLTLHEFSHPFINPVTELFRDEIMPFAANFEKIPEQTRRNVCGEWEECINEFIVRAITTRLSQQESTDLGQWAYNHELARGVVHMDELLEKIKYYEANRDQYPTFNDYYPRLLEIFMTDDF